MSIHLVLADDWELRGNGSGDPFAIQFNTARRLMDIYDTFALKGTFNVEIMQQLYHGMHSNSYPELKEIYDEWENVVKEMYTRGHDVQLHIHPQWINAEYLNGEWLLSSDWDLTNYPRDIIKKLVSGGIGYLEGVLKPLDNNYKCVSYRGGAWVFAPNRDIVEILAESGIKFDMSIVKGLYVTSPVSIDYRCVEEGIYPYYPMSSDARRVGCGVSSLVCIPTHRMYSRPELRALILKSMLKFVKNRKLTDAILSFVPGSAISIVNSGCRNKNSGLDGNKPGKRKALHGAKSRVNYFLKKTTKISDISSLSYFECKKAVEDIRRKAKKYSGEHCPFVFACHTKNIGNFKALERLARYLSKAEDIEVITATQMSNNINSGLYKIKTNSKFQG